jgi:hypothetical protein
MTKITVAESGSGFVRGMDPRTPDPHQNVMDPEHWLFLSVVFPLYDRVKVHLMNRHMEAPADQELDFMVLLPQEQGEKDNFNIASYEEVSPARTLHNFSNVHLALQEISTIHSCSFSPARRTVHNFTYVHLALQEEELFTIFSNVHLALQELCKISLMII